eukprot:3254275-Pyramimonas_sp.AAC.1
MEAPVPCEPCHWGLRRSSHGAAKRVRGVPRWMRRCRGDPPTGAFGGAPMRPRNVSGLCRNGGGGAMRTLPLGPSAGL